MAAPLTDSMDQGVCKCTTAAERLRVPGWPPARRRAAAEDNGAGSVMSWPEMTLTSPGGPTS